LPSEVSSLLFDLCGCHSRLRRQFRWTPSDPDSEDLMVQFRTMWCDDLFSVCKSHSIRSWVFPLAWPNFTDSGSEQRFNNVAPSRLRGVCSLITATSDSTCFAIYYSQTFSC
jgi:hypothetical protein